MTSDASTPEQLSTSALLAASQSVSRRLDTCLALQFSDLKRRCSRAGKPDDALLDQHQRASYTLALAMAELQAGKALLDYALAGPADAPARELAPVFVADTVTTIVQRLTTLRGELPLDEPLAALEADPDYRSLLRGALHSTRMEQLAARLFSEQLPELPSGLSEDEELLRSSLRRFAEQVIVPEAEAIHRQDGDIPETLIRQVAELGCFGSCIPERFGGSQPDDAPDSLGMIVITEELSRASLGAAGSLITRPEIARPGPAGRRHRRPATDLAAGAGNW